MKRTRRMLAAGVSASAALIAAVTVMSVREASACSPVRPIMKAPELVDAAEVMCERKSCPPTRNQRSIRTAT